MRVLHVIPALNPFGGGPPVACASLAAAQAGEGAEVGMLTYSHLAGDVPPSDYAAFPGFDRVKMHWVAKPSRAEIIHGHAARAKLREVIGQYDVLHIHGLWLTITYHAAKLARKAGKPYVLAPHGMLSSWALSEKPWKKKLALALGYRSMIWRAAAIHALSTHERDSVLDGGFHDTVSIIPNGVFLSDIDPSPAPGTFRAKHPELGADPYIFFLARLHPVKGLDLLADAMKALSAEHPTLRLVIAGPDYGAGEAFKAQIARLGIADRVHMLGAIYGRERFEAFADAACFVLPSKHEGFSMSIAEALASRCPPVITENCHLPDVAAARAGEVHERTVPALTRALGRVLGDAKLRAEYAANGRRLVEERFTWPAIARRSFGVYDRVLGRPTTVDISDPSTGPVPVAVITNVQTPYRVAFHQRIVREMPEIKLFTVYTHGEPDQPWAHTHAAEIRPVSFGEGESMTGGNVVKRTLNDYAKGGRIIQWLQDEAVRAVFLCGYNDAGRLRILRWCYERRVPVYLVADSNIHGDNATGPRRAVKSAIVSRVVRWSDLVLPCGRFGAEYFLRYGCDPTRIIFMPYEPDYDLITALPPERIEAVRAKHALKPDRRYAVFCGRMVRVKRPDLAVKAFLAIAERRPEWDLLLIGQGPLLEECKALVPESMKTRVRFLGFIGDASEIAGLYRAADVFVLPSDYEPWGVVVNEAAAAGLALVTSDVVGAAAELVRDGLNGRTFPPGDLDKLTAALADATDPANLGRYKAATGAVLADWRRRADPITGMRLALSRNRVILPH